MRQLGYTDKIADWPVQDLHRQVHSIRRRSLLCRNYVEHIKRTGPGANVLCYLHFLSECNVCAGDVTCGCSGAVAQDGRIEPGDMILEVNGISFEDMTNDEAVQTLRSAAQRPG